MTKNKQLQNLYASHLTGIEEISEYGGNHDHDIDGPLLMSCCEDYSSNCDKRILFIGQEHSSGEGWANDHYNGPMENYRTFNLGQEPGIEYNSTFWQAVRQFNAIINPSSNSSDPCYLWTNVSKYSTINGNRISEIDFQFISNRFDVLKKEIEIIKPDIIIFLSGPYYDNWISSQFKGNQDEKIELKSLYDNIPIREISRIYHSTLSDIKVYRTYHPNALVRLNKWNYLNLIAAHAMGFDFVKTIKDLKLNLETLGHEMDFSEDLGSKESGFYFKISNWKNFQIAFQFEERGMNSFFYGIIKNDGIETDEELNKKIQVSLDMQEHPSNLWPYWNWFEHKQWNKETFSEIENGLLGNKIKIIIEGIISKTQNLPM